MIPLPSIPKKIKEEKNKASFEIEALYPGYGITIGNALRRVLLSSLQGTAISEVKIKGASHQFSSISGVLEDTIIIIQNLKKIRFKFFEGDSHTAELKIKGEKKVKAGDFQLDPQLSIANPDCHIATLTDKKSELEMEIKIEKGIGYDLASKRIGKQKEIGVIPLDAIYTPVKKVNFQVENMRVGERTDFDKLTVEIETDGTETPEEAFKEAASILISHFELLLGSDTPSENKDVNKTKIEDLKLSNRTQKALINGNIKTVGGLLKKKESDILKLEGFGEKGLKEIKKEIKKIGLELKSDL